MTSPPTRDELLQLVYFAIDDFNGASPAQPLTRAPDAPLYSGDGVLDSLGLVHFIVSLEQVIADQTGRTVVLADEKAFSSHRSPFRDVPTLVDALQGHLGSKA